MEKREFKEKERNNNDEGDEEGEDNGRRYGISTIMMRMFEKKDIREMMELCEGMGVKFDLLDMDDYGGSVKL